MRFARDVSAARMRVASILPDASHTVLAVCVSTSGRVTSGNAGASAQHLSSEVLTSRDYYEQRLAFWSRDLLGCELSKFDYWVQQQAQDSTFFANFRGNDAIQV